MNKNIITLVLSIFWSLFSFAQENGSVSGNIISSDNMPIANVAVTVKGTKFGTQTDSQGNFEIKNLKADNYILKISSVGFKSKDINFSIQGNQATILPAISLNTNSEQLTEVFITGNANKYTKSESEYVSRMPIKNLENSQVYSVVTKELMKDQLVTSQDEALKNVPGLYQVWAKNWKNWRRRFFICFSRFHHSKFIEKRYCWKNH